MKSNLHALQRKYQSVSHRVLEETIQCEDVILITECTLNQWHLCNFYHTKEFSFKERMPKHLEEDPLKLTAKYNSLTFQ